MVHHLERSRHDTRGNDGRDGVARIINLQEISQQSTHRRCYRHQSQGRFSGYTECALGTNECAQQIVAGLFGPASTELDNFTAGQNHARAEYMVRSGAIFQAMNAAGILSDVAANGAGRIT